MKNLTKGHKNYGIKENRLKAELDGNFKPSNKEAPIIVSVREFLGIDLSSKQDFKLSGYHEPYSAKFEVNYEIIVNGKIKKGVISGIVLEPVQGKYTFDLLSISFC